jgi:hypothetical protein
MCTNCNCANLAKWGSQNILISIFVRERRRANGLEEGKIYSMNMATIMTIACYTCQRTSHSPWLARSRQSMVHRIYRYKYLGSNMLQGLVLNKMIVMSKSLCMILPAYQVTRTVEKRWQWSSQACGKDQIVFKDLPSFLCCPSVRWVAHKLLA